jgi:hypothetical protein
MTKEVLYQGLSELPVLIEDTSKNSLSYFRINSLPTELTAGKNLFSFSGNPYTFAEGSTLYVEVVDSTGTPIYTEVSINAESDDQYAIVSIFIDDTSAPGSGEIILCGTVDTDANGNSIDTSMGVNIRWSTPIQIYPSKRNSSSIVFGSLPVVTVSSSIKNHINYFYPGNNGRFTSSLHSGLSYLLYNNTPVLLTGSLSIPFTPDMVNGNIYISSSAISNLIPSTTNVTTVISESIKSFINSGSITLSNPLLIKQSNSNSINEFKSATVSTKITYEQIPNSSSFATSTFNNITFVFTNLEPIAGNISKIKTYYKVIGLDGYVFLNESDITNTESTYGYTTGSVTLNMPLPDSLRGTNLDFKFEFVNPYGVPSTQVVNTYDNSTQFRMAYGSFFDTQTQSGSANTAYAIKHNTTDFAYGISVTGSLNNTFLIASTGVYSVISSIQFVHSGGGTGIITSWVRINGVNLSNSATDLELKGNGAKDLYVINYFLNLKQNDLVEIMWSSSDSTTSLVYTAVRSTPDRPAVPSIITTFQQIA